jgi:hypothetical protein
VWPRGVPPADTTPDSEACTWWSGRYAGHDYAKRGLVSGELGWGAIHVTVHEVGFDARPLTTLDGGLLQENARDTGSILPLSEALASARRHLDAWYEACGGVRRDRPVVIVDRDIPNETLGLVLDTLSVHRFGQAALLVADRDPGERREVDPDNPGSFAVIRQMGTSVDAFSVTGERRATGTTRDLESLIATALNGEKYGCTVLAPQALGTWASVAATLDAAHGFGSRRQLIAPVPPGRARRAEIDDDTRRPTESLGLENTAGVFWVDLPDWSQSSGEWLSTCDREGGFAGARLSVSEPLLLALRGPTTDGVKLDPRLARPPDQAPEPVYWGGIDLGEPGSRPEAITALEERIAACTATAAERPEAPVQVRVRFEVLPSGTASAFDIVSPMLADPLHDCLFEAFRALPPFAPLGEHNHAAVVWPVVVKTAG